MRRWLYAYRHVAGTPAVLERTLLRHSIGLLRAATGSEGEGPAADGSYEMELHSAVSGLELSKTVRVKVGVASRSGPRVILPLTWHADLGRHAFPVFDGALEFEPLSTNAAQLSLVGSYRAPLGPVGAVADAALLHNVGQATADAIVAGLAEALSDAAGTSDVVYPTGPRRGQPLRVGDVMTEDPVVIDAGMPLRTAALLLFHAGISGAPVVKPSGELIGVISEGDLLVKAATPYYGLGRRVAEEDRRRTGATAGAVCSGPAKTTVPDASVTDVARAMLDEGVNRLIVLDEGRIAGIITRHDVLAALLRDDADIELAVRACLEEHGAADIEAAVQWGEVTLSGSTRLRSTVARLSDLILDLDGVIVVHDDDTTWEVDDVVPPFIYM